MNKSAQKGLAPLILVLIVGVVIGGIVIASKGSFTSKKSAEQTSQQSSSLYSSYDDNVSIQTPDGWTLKENPQPGTQATFFSPKEGVDDKFIENVGLSVSDLSAKPDVTLDEVVKAWIDQSQSEFPDSFKVISQDKTTLGGAEAVKLIYQAKDKVSSLKGMAIFALKDSKAYILSYSSEEKSFDKFLDGVNQIINSFKFGGIVLEWETFKNSEMGYSVKHPKGWVAKDSSGETNRKLTVSHPKNFANVLVAAHKDDSLKEGGGMAKAIKGRKEFLESDKELKIADFKATVEEKKGGWLMVGEKTIDGQKWQLEERGLVDIYGKVILMQSGYSEDYGKQYKDVVREIMDSFSVE
ncbi:hypothetical protein A3C59_03655 [Candidatus Daviesbacteria bacterium RIFCSPHIGHO2_02_FULL_36_13]|uniref:DUF1795 domain-containing protein n=1 Tax=Candidatus Daviesbacteria bacterium RIFCSPHIGHO2_02_FULL_36_13 TaxID=1797768 RepID=A0A1F5JX21_9BACT|nr:MAG: hypothetical protein A3C59_03655 [Candidatus Daviesbacteria bacterium RIFCSPHIGHO2_02_FULL_36_13]